MNIEYGKEYDYEEVKEIVRKKQIYILDTVVEICEQYGLIYWLDGGTLLGAVRHEGFIPWDDDIDIGLMRDDYEKLLSILSDELSEDLIMQSRDTDEEYKLPFVKVRDRYSKIEDDFENNGIFIDIFPFDYLPRSKVLKRVQYILLIILEVLFIVEPKKLAIYKKHGIYSYFLKQSTLIISRVGGFLGDRYFNIFHRKISLFYKISPGNEIGDGMIYHKVYFKSIRERKVYLPVKTIIFEGKKYNAPYDRDSYLKTLYGENYMTPVRFDLSHIEKISFLNQFNIKSSLCKV